MAGLPWLRCLQHAVTGEAEIPDRHWGHLPVASPVPRSELRDEVSIPALFLLFWESVQVRNECPCGGEGLQAQARRALTASARQGEGLQHHTPTCGAGAAAPPFHSSWDSLQGAGPSLAETSPCSPAHTEQSLMAWGRGQELSLAGHSVWLYSGGRGDGGLSRGSQAVPKAPGAVLLLAGPQL